MYPSSMTTALYDAARLAKRVAMDQGRCISLPKPIISNIRSVTESCRGWSAFKGDLARARKPSLRYLKTASDHADDTHFRKSSWCLCFDASAARESPVDCKQ